MKKYLSVLIICFFILSSLPVVANEHLQIVKRGKETITFNSIKVAGGTIETQIIIISSNINKRFSNVTGFADIGGDYGEYKRQLPITSRFDNPSHNFTISLGYSKKEKTIVCIQECQNTSEDTFEFPELQFDLEWFLLKNKSF